MKAIVIPKPDEIEIREIPMPEVKEGEALLKVKYVGICGAIRFLGSLRIEVATNGSLHSSLYR